MGFELTYGGSTVIVNPIYGGDIAKESAKEQGQMFYRQTISGSFLFINDDYDLIVNLPYDTVFTFYWEEQDFTGYFKLSDCKVDDDNRTVEVTPLVKDRYTDILNCLDKEFNLNEHAVPSTPYKCTIRPIYQIYRAGEKSITNFTGGNYWEEECEQIPVSLADVNDIDSPLVKSFNIVYGFNHELENVIEDNTNVIPSSYKGSNFNYAVDESYNWFYYQGGNYEIHYERYDNLLNQLSIFHYPNRVLANGYDVRVDRFRYVIWNQNYTYASSVQYVRTDNIITEDQIVNIFISINIGDIGLRSIKRDSSDLTKHKVCDYIQITNTVHYNGIWYIQSIDYDNKIINASKTHYYFQNDFGTPSIEYMAYIGYSEMQTGDMMLGADINPGTNIINKFWSKADNKLSLTTDIIDETYNPESYIQLKPITLWSRVLTSKYPFVSSSLYTQQGYLDTLDRRPYLQDGTVNDYIDIVPLNKNYPYSANFGYDEIKEQDRIIVGSSDSDIPTQYGKGSNGKYFSQPSGNNNLIPISFSVWNNMSFWIDMYSLANYMSQYDSKNTSVITIPISYKLPDIISKLLSLNGLSVTHSFSSAYSQILYSDATKCLTISPKASFTKKAQTAEDKAKNNRIKLSEIFNVLTSMQLYWYIDDENRLIIEKANYFYNNLSYSSNSAPQLSLNTDISNNGLTWEYGNDKYTIQKQSIPERYTFSWGDSIGMAFKGYPIINKSEFIDKGKIQDYNFGRFNPDIDFMLYAGENISNDGFSYVYVENNKANISTITGLNSTSFICQNPELSMVSLVNNYWLDSGILPVPTIEFMGSEINITTIARSKQQEVEFYYENDIDPYKTIETNYGYGVISKISTNLNTKSVKGTLLYTPLPYTVPNIFFELTKILENIPPQNDRVLIFNLTIHATTDVIIERFGENPYTVSIDELIANNYIIEIVISKFIDKSNIKIYCDTITDFDVDASAMTIDYIAFKNSPISNISLQSKNINKIDIFNCYNLNAIDISENTLSELILNNIPTLTSLDVHDNVLTKLKLDKTNNISYLDITNNNFTELPLNSLNHIYEFKACGNKLSPNVVEGIINIFYANNTVGGTIELCRIGIINRTLKQRLIDLAGNNTVVVSFVYMQITPTSESLRLTLASSGSSQTTVDWGDGAVTENANGSITHTFTKLTTVDIYTNLVIPTLTSLSIGSGTVSKIELDEIDSLTYFNCKDISLPEQYIVYLINWFNDRNIVSEIYVEQEEITNTPNSVLDTVYRMKVQGYTGEYYQNSSQGILNVISPTVSITLVFIKTNEQVFIYWGDGTTEIIVANITNKRYTHVYTDGLNHKITFGGYSGTSIRRLYVNSPTKVTNAQFINFSGLQSVEIKNNILNNVKFYNCTALNNITINNNLIKDLVLENIPLLKTLNIQSNKLTASWVNYVTNFIEANKFNNGVLNTQPQIPEITLKSVAINNLHSRGYTGYYYWTFDVNTTNNFEITTTSSNQTATIRLFDQTHTQLNPYINWGDGFTDNLDHHTYSASGIYYAVIDYTYSEINNIYEINCPSTKVSVIRLDNLLGIGKIVCNNSPVRGIAFGKSIVTYIEAANCNMNYQDLDSVLEYCSGLKLEDGYLNINPQSPVTNPTQTIYCHNLHIQNWLGNYFYQAEYTNTGTMQVDITVTKEVIIRMEYKDERGYNYIDWGDGHTEYGRPETTYTHTYTGTDIYTCIFKTDSSIDWLWLNDNNIISLDVNEFLSITCIWCYNNKLTSLVVDDLVNLIVLHAANNLIDSINLTYNTKLQSLTLSNNLFTSLNLTHNTDLTILSVNNNSLTTLNITDVNKLTRLYCNGNSLTSIDLSTKIFNSDNLYNSEINVSENNLTSLNVSYCTGLKKLTCDNNNLGTLNVSPNILLEYLSCINSGLTSLTIINTPLIECYCDGNSLTGLALTGLNYLKTLSCEFNDITSLNISNLIALNSIKCDNNSITSLVSNNTSVKYLDASFNSLGSISLSTSKSLIDIRINDNSLNNLSVSGLNNLSNLICSNNNISYINITNDKNLIYADCIDNVFIESQINNILKSLDSYGKYNGYLDLRTKGHLTPPTGTAIGNKVSLESRGWTVNTDSFTQKLSFTVKANSFQNFSIGLGTTQIAYVSWGGAIQYISGTVFTHLFQSPIYYNCVFRFETTATTINCSNQNITKINIYELLSLNTVFLDGNHLDYIQLDEILQALDTNGVHNGHLDIEGQLTLATPTNTTAINNLHAKGWTGNYFYSGSEEDTLIESSDGYTMQDINDLYLAI